MIPIGVVIGFQCCSADGINRLSNDLTLIHDRLQKLVNDKKDCDACNVNCGPLIIIPNHMTWIVTMWRFGADSSIEYTGEVFC